MRNIKYGTKIFLFSLLAVVPVLIIVTIFYNEVIQVLTDNAEKDTLSLLKKSNDIIDLKLAEIENETSLIATDRDLYEIFSKDLPSNQYELSLINQEIRRVLNSFFSKYEHVYASYLVTTKMSFGQNSNMFIPLDNFYKSDLYRTAQETGGSIRWVPTHDFCKVFNTSEYNNIELDYRYIFFEVCTINSMYIDSSFDRGSLKVYKVGDNIEKPVLLVVLKEDFLKKAFEDMNAFKGASYYYLTQQGQVVSSMDADEIGSIKDDELLKCFDGKKSGTTYMSIDGRKHLICFDTIETTGWLSAVIIPYSSLLESVPNSGVFIIFISILVILLFILVALFGSRKMAEPIKKMLIVMDAMSQGNFNSRIIIKSRDEIGTLFEYFNTISEKIKRLIEENYLVKIREKEAHIRALTTQINPHFITNTLNTINWMAIENNQENISNMLISLSNMMDYIIRNKKELVEFRVELKALENYLYIMSNKYEDTFEVEYETEEKILNSYVPKLFLQPIIENAIVHGFEDMKTKGKIRITAKTVDSRRIFSVEDNGKGMSEEQIKEIMDMETQSIGIRNVDERVKLLYGSDFGIHIVSAQNHKTIVSVILPIT